MKLRSDDRLRPSTKRSEEIQQATKPTRIVSCLLLFASITPGMMSDEAPKPIQQGDQRKVGYLDCSNRDKKDFLPLLVGPCSRVPVSNARCGEKVDVLEHQGDLLKVAREDGVPHYIESNSVSQKEDSFVPFDANSGIADAALANCPTHVTIPPRAVFAPDPEYSEKASRAHIQGVVTIALTVGIDGKPHDITVVKKLGYGLDEKAVEAARQWRFQPATRDGKPVEAKIQMVMTFRSFNLSR